jgi:hypothetical protein
VRIKKGTVMKCPKCGLINPDEAQRCDCGYDFENHTMEKSYFYNEKEKELRLLPIFLLLIFFGFLGAHRFYVKKQEREFYVR